MLQHLAGRRGVAGAQRVQHAEFQPVQPRRIGQPVPQRFLRDRCLRHAEATEGAGGRVVGEDRARPRGDRRDAVGPHAMHRHPAGDRRAPACIGAGVVGALEGEAGQPARRIAAGPRGDARRVALRAAGHALRPRQHRAHRPPQQPGGDRQHRLDRDIQLAAEAAAAGRGDDPHIGLQDAQHARHFLEVHIGRLGAGKDFYSVTDALRPAGLGLDIGVLDEAGLDADRGDMGAGRKRGFGIAGDDAAGGQHVVGPAVVQRGAALDRHRLQHLEGDRQVVEANRLQRHPVADQGAERVAAVAQLAGREDRLVLYVGIDAEAVPPWHVLRGQHPHEAGMPSQEGRPIAEGEARAGMGAAHRPEPERIGRRRIRAEQVGAG